MAVLSQDRSCRQDFHARRPTTEVSEGCRPRDRERRIRLHHRPFRLRQVDPAQSRRGSDRRDHAAASFCEDREVEQPGPDRAIVFQNHACCPGSRSMAMCGSPSTRCSAGEKIASRAASMDDAQSRSRADDACQGQASFRNFRRHEAARRHRPRARHGTEGAAARRAVRRARRADARPFARQRHAHPCERSAIPSS